MIPKPTRPHHDLSDPLYTLYYEAFESLGDELNSIFIQLATENPAVFKYEAVMIVPSDKDGDWYIDSPRKQILVTLPSSPCVYSYISKRMFTGSDIIKDVTDEFNNFKNK